MFSQDKVVEVIHKPAPEFNDIHYAGDGRLFLLKGIDGHAGIIPVLGQGPNIPPYVTSLSETIPDVMNPGLNHEYAKFHCDFLVTNKVKLQSTDLKIIGAHCTDFVVFEVLYLADPANDIWILGKRFVKRFYVSTDREDQDTPTLEYAKVLQPGVFAIRMIYYKNKLNAEDVCLRANYMLHEVDDESP